MRSLSLRIISFSLAILVAVFAMALRVDDTSRGDDSPHGDDFEISCSVCHSPKGWEVDYEIYSFDHSETNLPLLGQHTTVNCKLCHPSLVFTDAGTDCISCHTDMHYQTVGPDCARCHTPQSWIVNNITEIHQLGRFPLLGPHLLAECMDCHPSASQLRFEPLRTECYDCHQEDYASASNPNHVLGNFSTDCMECHTTLPGWSPAQFPQHDVVFPLTQGHAINECSSCHINNDYVNTSSECVACHQADYNNTSNPNHVTAGLSTVCMECHTTAPGWKPAAFPVHDAQFFPINTGKHQGEWNTCADCHTNPGSWAVFSCIDCHEHNRNDMDDKHSEQTGYEYASAACLDCHPDGSHE